MGYFLGVDVGTSSVRVGLFTSTGKLIDTRKNDITIHNPAKDYYEQSSEEIWNAICLSINELVQYNCNEKKLLLVDEIVSIGFDATCSLVVLDLNYQPLVVSNFESCSKETMNIIMWMDHRSIKQADFINSTKHKSLQTVGQTISPEMDPSKILWLKENMFHKSYSKAMHLFSLPDYLVWRSSNIDVRSMCSATCKWFFNARESRWDETFWSEIGLKELTESDFSRIGTNVKEPFSHVDELKISNDMVERTGLKSNVSIGVSMIDAHAGGIGGLILTLNHLKKLHKPVEIKDILVLVSGTSSCIMASSSEANYINGIWGPYYNAMVPGLFLNEAGQSLCGKLIDHVIENHSAYETLKKKTNGRNIYDELYQILNEMIEEGDDVSELTKNIHIYPDYHGNRSPLADSNLKGSICGLSLDNSVQNLAIQYLASLQSIVYQTKQIIETMNNHSMVFKVLTVIGGLSNNSLYCQLISDICEIPVLVSKAGEALVLLGSSVLGAANSIECKHFKFLELIEIFSGFDDSNTVILQPNIEVRKYHAKKYKIFLKMLQDQQSYIEIMNSS